MLAHFLIYQIAQATVAILCSSSSKRSLQSKIFKKDRVLHQLSAISSGIWKFSKIRINLAGGAQRGMEEWRLGGRRVEDEWECGGEEERRGGVASLYSRYMMSFICAFRWLSGDCLRWTAQQVVSLGENVIKYHGESCATWGMPLRGLTF